MSNQSQSGQFAAKTPATETEQSSATNHIARPRTHEFNTMSNSDTTIPEIATIDWELAGINISDHSAPKSSVVPAPDGNLIIAGDTGSLYSVSRDDGAVNWGVTTHPSPAGIHGTPVIAEETVYVGAYDGAMYAFDVATGERQWRTQFGPDVPSWFGGSIGGSPVYHEGVIYIAVEFATPCPSGGLFALDATTGEVEHEDRWPDHHPHSTPAIDHGTGTLAFGANDGTVYAWSFPDLERKWAFEIIDEDADTDASAEGEDDDGDDEVHGDVKGAIGLYDNAFFFGSWDESVYRVDAATGSEQWQFETDGKVMGGTAVDPATGTVYTGSHDQHCYALDAASGDEEWRFETDGRITGHPTITPEHVLIGSYDGHLYALDKATGEEAWSISNDGWITSKPFVHDGGIYFTEDAGDDMMETGSAYRFSSPP